MNNESQTFEDLIEYFSRKLRQYGTTPLGVDWNSPDAQRQRFEQVCKILPTSEPYSLNDLGCGYGALLEYLDANFPNYAYTGYDFCPEMIDAARSRYEANLEARFALAEGVIESADYGIASGIFNLRLTRTNEEWLAHMKKTIRGLSKTSRVGFAFNCLTRYSDSDKMRDDLYYADPCVIFDFCKRECSPNVALLHDYGLYEFTVLVKKGASNRN